MKPICADVKNDLGTVKHYIATESGAETISTPVRVKVVFEHRAFYLLRLDEEGMCIADTWHMTLEEAKREAQYEYGISLSEWKGCEDENA